MAQRENDTSRERREFWLSVVLITALVVGIAVLLLFYWKFAPTGDADDYLVVIQSIIAMYLAAFAFRIGSKANLYAWIAQGGTLTMLLVLDDVLYRESTTNPQRFSIGCSACLMIVTAGLTAAGIWFARPRKTSSSHGTATCGHNEAVAGSPEELG